jgi:anhydro-N-acetylmuramic acid kinase
MAVERIEQQRVVGLISGTSVDGIDAALVEISGTYQDLQVNLLAGATYPYPPELRARILNIVAGGCLSIAELAELDDAIAYEFAQAAIAIQTSYPAATLIGSHGQTVYHRPPPPLTLTLPTSPLGYTCQLGRGDLIAHLTQTPTVSNFRAADIALGGHGAPLVPLVDACLLSHPDQNRCIQNIGGIGNVAYLPATQGNDNFLSTIRGWDTGPGNTLLDLAVHHLSNGQLTFDADGAWAAQGKPCQVLVQQWLQQEFFQQPPPKSTGRETFGWDYLHQCLQDMHTFNLSAADILATLTELTAASIAHSYKQFLPKLPDQVLLCGGGSHNCYLRARLAANLVEVAICTTTEVGLSLDFKEAIAFAVLAYWRQLGLSGNLPQVTGARQTALLGDLHPVAKEFGDDIQCRLNQRFNF